MVSLQLNILPAAQLKLWPLLKDIPKEFTLYGGTAIALQLGHRISIDFDFFSDSPLNKEKLITQFSLLQQYRLVQPEINTIDCIVDFPEGSVKLQFLANYGKTFDPASSLRALCSYRDGNLNELDKETKNYLSSQAASVENIPVIQPSK